MFTLELSGLVVTTALPRIFVFMVMTKMIMRHLQVTGSFIFMTLQLVKPISVALFLMQMVLCQILILVLLDQTSQFVLDQPQLL